MTSPAERFTALPWLLANDEDLQRRGRWLTVECRIDIGHKPFYLSIRDGALANLDHGASLMRSSAFCFRGMDEAWIEYWKPIPAPGWHDLLALTKRGVASVDGDLRPFMQNLQYFKDLLALPRGSN